ncbi:hypothetical protein [Amycolatopsis sp. CA-230715]|uniref:hypothetical protein n=1 Tax=Amycolatopsis sp. CA-230715 TaxID=2745196 RepID=UPI001C00BF8F|nr:hypothetical protein [Amycolatopsis sp. CA-230715]QWF85843.1 hypothetical protein HUW46_09323 [Amycolatopsis sp. CA-230715]
MPWNFMEVIPFFDGRRLMPECGPGGLTRSCARSKIQGILDDAAAHIGPPFDDLAQQWGSSDARDFVTDSRSAWLVYEHEDDAVLAGAREHAVRFAQELRKNGVDLHVADPDVSTR